jgi:hypothetical protein
MSERPRSPTSTWRRRASVASAALLGLALLILADGSWLGALPSRGLDGHDLRYFLREPDILALGPARLWLVGGAVFSWAIPLAWFRRRSPRWLLVVPWLACFAIAVAQYATWRALSTACEAHVTRVFDDARRGAGTTRFAGLYGVADLAGSRTALSPDHRFARYSWGCMGTYDIGWGRYVEDGTLVELIPERSGFWSSLGRLDPRRFRVRESQLGRDLEEVTGDRDGGSR